MRTSFQVSALLLLTLLAGAAQAQTATLRGRVESTTGTALTGATVRATLRGTTTTATATTTAEGVYEITGLAAGRYVVSAGAAGYTTVTRDDVNPGAGQTVTLATFRLAPLTPPLPVRVTFAGTIVDDASRRPVAGARVNLLTASGARIAADTTGADGTFEVSATMAERTALLVRVEATGYLPAIRPVSESTSRLTIGLAPVATASASVAGTVRAGGQPVAGVRVRITRMDVLALPFTRERTTSATGAYRFDSLAAGSYLLSASASGYKTIVAEARVSSGQALQKDLELRVAEPEPVRVEVTGRVVTDGTGAPVGHARVTLYAVQDSGAVRPAGSAHSGSDGRFVVRVAPGRYIAAVRISGERGAPSYAEFYRDAPTPAEATALSVGTVAATTIEFSVPPTPQRVAVRVRGRVTDAAGAPLASATVTFAQRDTKAPLGSARTAADGSYDAQFEAYAPLSFIASARREGYTPEYYREAATADAATAVNLNTAPFTAENISFTLDVRPVATGALSGAVTSAAGAQVISGASVRAYAGERRTTVAAGTDGRYSFPALTAGSYILLASADGYAPTYAGSTAGTWLDATRVAVGPTATTANIALPTFAAPTGTNRIVGKAATRDGRVVAGALVRAFDGTRRLAAYTFTNDRGGYELAGLDSGRYVVTIELPFAGVWGETVDVDTTSAVQGMAHFVVTTETAITAAEPRDAAAGLTLDVPMPNPVRGAVVLRYALAEAQPVALRIYDTLGRTVATVEAGVRAAGVHRIAFDAATLAPGLYVVRLDAGLAHRTQALVVVR